MAVMKTRRRSRLLKADPMTHPADFEPDDQRALRLAFREGAPLVCPLCDVALDRRPVPPRRDVSYVRDRLWVNCPSCHRRVVLDRRQPE